MKAFIINMIIIFFIKVIDNIISTSKVILVQKNRAFLAALTVVISNIIFYKLIEKTTTNMIQKISSIFAVNPLISKEI